MVSATQFLEVSEATAKFSGQVVWITGASSGIGEGMAKAFAAFGSKVVLSARNISELTRVRDECLSKGADCESLLILPLDVIDFDAMPKAFKIIIDKFSRIDVLINNAGQGARDFAVDIDLSIYRRIMDVNLFSAIALSKLVLPTMIKQRSGRILGVSSLAGKIGVPLRTAYCPAKHAVLGFFDALRCEVAFHGISVNVIVPGVVRTGAVANALTGTGQPIGAENGVMEGGLSVEEALDIILVGLIRDVDEIEVAVESESQMMKMKRDDPTSVFRLLENSAEKELYNL